MPLSYPCRVLSRRRAITRAVPSWSSWSPGTARQTLGSWSQQRTPIHVYSIKHIIYMSYKMLSINSSESTCQSTRWPEPRECNGEVPLSTTNPIRSYWCDCQIPVSHQFKILCRAVKRFSPKSPQLTPHSSPLRASCGMSPVSDNW